MESPNWRGVMCGQAEIVERTIDNSAAYLHGWLEQIAQRQTYRVSRRRRRKKQPTSFSANTRGIAGQPAESVAAPAPLEVAA